MKRQSRNDRIQRRDRTAEAVCCRRIRGAGCERSIRDRLRCAGLQGACNYRSGAPVSAELLGRMCDLIAHRGPDADGVWTDGPVGLGHRRLAIIDLSPGRASADDHRPTAGSTITFNGEIYNFLELRRELENARPPRSARGATPRSCSALTASGASTAVAVPRACSRLPSGTPTRAGCSSRATASARSRCTIWLDRDGIAFASEPKAFLADPAFTPEPESRKRCRRI